MKLAINCSFLKTVALLALLAWFSASVATTQAAGFRTSSGAGYLLVYSATDEVSDGDTAFNPHSSYVICTSTGKFLRNVENHISRSDEIPELVKLSPGFYSLEARSANNGYVHVRVMIEPGRRTIVDLDSRS
jgi:hypothetical protein